MLLYNLVILLYGLIIKIAALKKTKAKLWVTGRKNWRKNLSEKINKLNSNNIIWVHCASYGEFEQGRPLIEAIKKQNSKLKIVLTFFSPSGYQAFKNWQGADIICYLPLDTKRNAQHFLNIVNPQKAIFIKYEFWLNFLNTLKSKNIPTYLVSAVFKPHHPFFKWYGGIFKKSLSTFKTLFIQDIKSANLLKTINVLNYQVCGDTRFDRVIELKQNFTPLPYFENFCGTNFVFIAGSTWPSDDELIIEAYQQLNNPNLKLILVPHEVDKKNIQRLTELLIKNNLLFSLYSQNINNSSSNILIVDAIGLLNKIYHYATVTYIGGGFNSGLHNTLEPAVYLKPVLFYGQHSDKYNEVIDLVNLNAAKSVASVTELKNELTNFINNPKQIKIVEDKLIHYFQQNSGSTQKIIHQMF